MVSTQRTKFNILKKKTHICFAVCCPLISQLGYIMCTFFFNLKISKICVFYVYFFNIRLDLFFIEGVYVAVVVFQWVPCIVYRTHKPLFSTKLSLKMGLTALFTHLKIILLQCFQFSVK